MSSSEDLPIEEISSSDTAQDKTQNNDVAQNQTEENQKNKSIMDQFADDDEMSSASSNSEELITNQNEKQNHEKSSSILSKSLPNTENEDENHDEDANNLNIEIYGGTSPYYHQETKNKIDNENNNLKVLETISKLTQNNDEIRFSETESDDSNEEQKQLICKFDEEEPVSLDVIKKNIKENIIDLNSDGTDKNDQQSKSKLVENSENQNEAEKINSEKQENPIEFDLKPESDSGTEQDKIEAKSGSQSNHESEKQSIKLSSKDSDKLSEKESEKNSGGNDSSDGSDDEKESESSDKFESENDGVNKSATFGDDFVSGFNASLKSNQLNDDDNNEIEFSEENADESESNQLTEDFNENEENQNFKEVNDEKDDNSENESEKNSNNLKSSNSNNIEKDEKTTKREIDTNETKKIENESSRSKSSDKSKDQNKKTEIIKKESHKKELDRKEVEKKKERKVEDHKKTETKEDDKKSNQTKKLETKPNSENSNEKKPNDKIIEKVSQEKFVPSQEYLHNSPRSDANEEDETNFMDNEAIEDARPLPLKKLSEICSESATSTRKTTYRTANTTSRNKPQKLKYSIDEDPDVPVFSWQKKDKENVQSSNKKPTIRNPSPPRNSSPKKAQQQQTTQKQQNKQHQTPQKQSIQGSQHSMFITQVSGDVKTVDEERRLRLIEDEKKKKRLEAERRRKEEEERLKRQIEAEKIQLFEEERRREQLEEKKRQKAMQEEEARHSQFEDDKQKKLIKKPAVYQRKRMTMAMMQFTGVSPSIPMTKQLDLSKYDYDDFDESLAANIPERLLELLTHGKESIVFRALCGVSIVKYPSNVISKVLMELKHYLDLCVEKGLIAEGSYVQCIIEAIKDERKEKNQIKDNSLEKVTQQLQQAESQYEKRKSSWENQKSIMQVDKELQLEDLELRFQEESMKLDEEWNSEKMQQKFNKPSPALIEMRHNARSLLAAHRFEEAAQVAEEIAKKEIEETEEAAKRMSQSYQAAIARLRDKFDNERDSMDDSFRTKYSALLRAEEANLRPISQRIEKFKNMKEDAELAMKRSKTSYGRPKSQRKPVLITAKHPPIVLDAKLKLPPLSKGGVKPQVRETRSALSDVI